MYAVQRHYRLIVAFAVGVLISCVVLVLWPAAVVAPDSTDVEMSASSSAAFLAAELPKTLRIPTIDLIAPFSAPLGLAENGEVEVPGDYVSVGYYKYGPMPGSLGPAVVLGHVDSYEGPAVFWSLGQLSIGDLIYVDREDGSTAVFRVTHLERHPQSDFPTTAVYGDIDHAGLRLITCSGTYKRGEQRYTHNLIVFADLIDHE